MATYRTFVAIELPDTLRARLIEHIQQLRSESPDARASWSREQNLHLTLKFLGDVSVVEIPNLSNAIARAVSGLKPFELMVAGCGVFPLRGRPNVLWIGVKSSPQLRTSADPECSQHPTPDTQPPLSVLHSGIENECAAAGFDREQRAFHPHLTIARVGKHGDERRLADAHQKLSFSPETFAASEVVVFKSELLSEGSKHTAISRHTLQD